MRTLDCIQKVSRRKLAISIEIGYLQYQTYKTNRNDWLDNMSKFVQFVKTMPKPSSDKGWPGVRVAIIDDGTEIMQSAEFRNNIKDGRSFSTRFDHRRNHHRTAPYYFSHSGHGTVMAQYILRVCPMADLYIARLDCGVSPDANKPGIHPTIASAAKVSCASRVRRHGIQTSRQANG